MEQISSTFPFQDGLLHFSPISARQQTRPPVSDHNSNPLLVFDLLKGDDDVVPTMKHNVVLQQHQQLQQRNPNNPHQERKIIRRDVERQRRKEMGGLYKSLVGLIPYEYIKGKRSTSDRLQETVRYVKDLRKRVEKLSAKRDELKGVTEAAADLSSNSLLRPAAASSSSLMKGRDECNNNNNNNNDEQSRRVTVKACRAGVEVTVNVGAQKIKGGGGVSLSKILKVLVGDGLSINNCCSIKVNDRLLQTIEAEVIGGGSIDPTQLEQKLSVLVYNHGGF